MTKRRFVICGGELVELDLSRPPPPSLSPAVWGDLPAYKSPLGTGVIEGRRARRDDLRRAGCRETDPSEFKPVENKPWLDSKDPRHLHNRVKDPVNVMVSKPSFAKGMKVRG